MKTTQTVSNADLKQQTIGSFVKADFPEFDFKDIIAKVDTGAYTGALHTTKIFEKKINQRQILYFSPFDHPDLVRSTDKFFVKYVKSSIGKRQKRYVIDTVIRLDDQDYPVFLTLADRSDMAWPVLIGRRFLRRYNFVVDVKVGTKYRLQRKAS